MNSQDFYELLCWFEQWGLTINIYGTIINDQNIAIYGAVMTGIATLIKVNLKQ